MNTATLERSADETEWYAIPIRDIASPQKKFIDMDRWCTDVFGQGIVASKHFPNMANLENYNDEGRWGIFHGRIFFRYREDMLMFMLRWS
jgi:hypothetical protein